MSRRARPALLFGLALVLGGALSANAGDRTERVSVGSGGRQGNGNSDLPALSADGRFVAFEFVATNLSPRATDGQPHIFVRDRQYGRTEHVAVGRTPAISAGGRFVAFPSHASDLVSGDTNGTTDVFVRDRGLGLYRARERRARGLKAMAAAPTMSRTQRFPPMAALSSSYRKRPILSSMTPTASVTSSFTTASSARPNASILGLGLRRPTTRASYLRYRPMDASSHSGRFPPTLCQTIPMA